MLVFIRFVVCAIWRFLGFVFEWFLLVFVCFSCSSYCAWLVCLRLLSICDFGF